MKKPSHIPTLLLIAAVCLSAFCGCYKRIEKVERVPNAVVVREQQPVVIHEDPTVIERRKTTVIEDR